MKTRAACIGVILATVSIGTTASAQTEAWVANGPNGGAATALAVDPARPATVNAATGNGVFRSDDAGGCWSNRSNGLGSRAVNALVIDPAGTSVIYASPAGTIHKSVDAGASWQVSDSGIRFKTVTALAISPASPSTLYAGSYDGAFKSVDAGASWTVMPGLYAGGSFIPAIAVDPQVPTTLYAANFDGAAVYKSRTPSATRARRFTSRCRPRPRNLYLRHYDPAGSVPHTLATHISRGGDLVVVSSVSLRVTGVARLLKSIRPTQAWRPS